MVARLLSSRRLAAWTVLVGLLLVGAAIDVSLTLTMAPALLMLALFAMGVHPGERLPAGASVDVFGVHSNQLPTQCVRASQEYPRLRFKREFVGLLRAGVKRVPRGRAWYLHRFAVSDLSIRVAPFRG